MADAEQHGPPVEATIRSTKPATDQVAEETAQLISLEAVHPDPEQPRRLLPADLAEALTASSPPQEILTQLRARAERDKWARERLRELDALAQSIAEDGLLQPIRVLRDGEDRYCIEEGERRWWAHHILVQQGRQEFRCIKAFVVEREPAEMGVLRRRVAENILRSEFTAIELARAMASRIQEILGAEPGAKRGDAERRVGSENGMSDRRVRQFVALLTLSPEAQELAQQARLTENSLRPVIGFQDAARQLAAIRAMLQPHPQEPKSPTDSRLVKPPRTARSQGRKTGARKRRIRTNRKAVLSRKHPGHKISRKMAAVRPASIPLWELLKLAKILAQENLRLGPTDWKRVVKTESDREVLAKLHTVLHEGLVMSAEVDQEVS